MLTLESQLVSIESIGKRLRGCRDIWLMRVTLLDWFRSGKACPSWADGNIHATELALSSSPVPPQTLVAGPMAPIQISQTLLHFYICLALPPLMGAGVGIG